MVFQDSGDDALSRRLEGLGVELTDDGDGLLLYRLTEGLRTEVSIGPNPTFLSGKFHRRSGGIAPPQRYYGYLDILMEFD